MKTFSKMPESRVDTDLTNTDRAMQNLQQSVLDFQSARIAFDLRADRVQRLSAQLIKCGLAVPDRDQTTGISMMQESYLNALMAHTVALQNLTQTAEAVDRAANTLQLFIFPYCPSGEASNDSEWYEEAKAA